MMDPALSPGSLASECSLGICPGFQTHTILHAAYIPQGQRAAAGEGTAILTVKEGRSLVEEMVLKLLEVTGRAMCLQGLMPGI